MNLSQNDLERLKDRIQKGEITAMEANIEQVRITRVRLVTSKIPADVRKALNSAVKRGYLAHMKKEGHKPEAYYHPTFDYLAKEERAEHEQRSIAVLRSVLV